MPNAIEQIIEPRAKDLGGFFVRRLLPFHARRSVGPFVFFDHLGPAVMAPGHGMDVRSHPHIGLATVTWLYDGALDHRDSLGTVQTIRPGAVNWMTAGKGITHSERTPAPERSAGHRIEAIQTWVALPQSHAEQSPSFVHWPEAKLPKLEHGGAKGVIIAGSAFGLTSPVEFPSPILQLVVEAQEAAAFETPAARELCVYVVEGHCTVDGQVIPETQMAVLHTDASARIELGKGARVMLAGGDPLDGPRLLDWNFVATSKERLEKAEADWRASIAGGFKGTWFTQPPGEASYIPLPGDPQPDPMDTPPL